MLQNTYSLTSTCNIALETDSHTKLQMSDDPESACVWLLTLGKGKHIQIYQIHTTIYNIYTNIYIQDIQNTRRQRPGPGPRRGPWAGPCASVPGRAAAAWYFVYMLYTIYLYTSCIYLVYFCKYLYYIFGISFICICMHATYCHWALQIT